MGDLKHHIFIWNTSKHLWSSCGHRKCLGGPHLARRSWNAYMWSKALYCHTDWMVGLMMLEHEPLPNFKSVVSNGFSSKIVLFLTPSHQRWLGFLSLLKKKISTAWCCHHCVSQWRWFGHGDWHWFPATNSI